MKAILDVFTFFPIGKKKQSHINCSKVKINVNNIDLEVIVFPNGKEMTSNRLDEAIVKIKSNQNEFTLPIKQLVQIIEQSLS